MAMLLLFAAFALMLGGGAAALLFPNDPKRASAVGAGGAVGGSAVGLAFSLLTLSGGGSESFRQPWGFPNGSFYLSADALSAFFLAVIFLLTAVTAVFGAPYLRSHGHGRSLGPSWFWFNGLAVSMALVLVAQNALLFLVGWETMALTSFFLVMFDADAVGVRRAGWIYLVATHLGTGCVVLFFAGLAARAGSLDFDHLSLVGAPGGAPAGLLASALFLLALAGFGTKAGFVPLHVWLPEAHPVAPSHVSAVMSGAMIKTGIFGLIRALGLLGPPELWWGWLLIAVGATSGVLGVLFALAQHDLKRLLAYHSVENIGIMALGLGVGVLGLTAGAPLLVFFGFAGALLHVLNHAVFKSLLFLGAGAVQTAAGTLDLERLGGLMRAMPRTGAAFLVGSASIAGLPPLNGFVSEFLVFSGAFVGAATLGPAYALPLAVAAGALALIGGLAAACFVKAAGVVFLGEPRSAAARGAKEVSRLMVAPQLVLAGACVALGVGAPAVLAWAAPAVAAASGLSLASAQAAAAGVAEGSLTSITLAFLLVALLTIALTALRAGLQRGRSVVVGPTWDCGYDRPSPRMEYTASSFAAPLTHYFRNTLRTRIELRGPDGPFPAGASLKSETPDAYLEGLFGPVFGGARRALGGLLPLQNGRVQYYVLYLVAALMALLLWEAL